MKEPWPETVSTPATFFVGSRTQDIAFGIVKIVEDYPGGTVGIFSFVCDRSEERAAPY